MARSVLPSKLVDERILVEFDFLDELAWGEVIVSATIIIVVEVGIDALPQEMLYKDPSVVLDRYVHQQVYNGVPGVLYQIKCTAVSNLSISYEKFVRLAILPDYAQLPLFNATYLTSRPYPIEDQESLTSAFNVMQGLLQGQHASSGEAFVSIFTILSGSLYGGAVVYGNWPPEGFVTEFNPLFGELYGGGVTYNWLPGEGLTVGILPLQGTLVGGRVAYDDPGAGLYTQFNPLSGTLS